MSKDRIESKSYISFAEDLAQQFRDGESVHAGNLSYLENFSDDSHRAYEWLMDSLAQMYNVTPRDAIDGQNTSLHAVATAGRLVLDHLN